MTEGGPKMYAERGWHVLHNRYELTTPLMPEVTGWMSSDGAVQPSEAWIGIHPEHGELLIKLWPYQTEAASDLQRALWDVELRTMYRVSSSPGSDESLLTIREAGLDEDHHCFVMVMHGADSGYDILQDSITHRRNHTWLSNTDLDTRRRLWMGLKQVAEGIRLLHSQNVLHRNVGAENVFLREDMGPSSFRLGGFEWSVRLGELHLTQPPTGWSSPPEFASGKSFGYHPETDWYGFGILAVRCLLNVEPHRKYNPKERHHHIIEEIESASSQSLSEHEKLILQRLIARERPDRLVRGYEIITSIDTLIESMRNVPIDSDKNILVLVYNPGTNLDLIEAAQEAGYVPDVTRSEDLFNPNDILHVNRLSEFIRDDLTEALLYSIDDEYMLVGKRLGYKTIKFRAWDRSTNQRRDSWDAAYCGSVRDLRWKEGRTAFQELPRNAIIARTIAEINHDPKILGNARSWERYLPLVEKSGRLRASLAQFHDFIRCTNQLELLIRDAELFPYEIIQSTNDGKTHTLVIKEIERERPVMKNLLIEGGLTQFLQREMESAKENSRLVLLDSVDSLRFDQGIKIEPKDCFQVDEISSDDKVTLKRTAIDKSLRPPPEKGWLRAWGMFGQMDLIRRRKEAIDRLASHSYLLRSLAMTGQVYMETGERPLPQPLPLDRVDVSKQAAMRDILRTRPIYALNGPPGTGKTTMVAHLLRQIFMDDPVAQVLITAQAHGAVDVLRTMVRTKAFEDVADAEQPLAIRLGRDDPAEELLEGSVQSVARDILQRAIQNLRLVSAPSPVQTKWLEQAKPMLDAIRTRSAAQNALEFIELVKRGANITYCTTSAGDLEELARSTQFYDWAIIEEAGKCHGFDLALPLQAGHRWLLIGDQFQLPPYRYSDYLDALSNLENAVEYLKALPNHAAGLLDQDWIQRWEGMTVAEQSQFKVFARLWLTTFERIYKTCLYAPRGQTKPMETSEESEGAVAGMLSLQYRMHPTIGTVISEAFYEGRIRNKTERKDGRPEDRVIAPITEPAVIRDVGIVWLDTPHARKSDIAREFGPDNNRPRYTNPYEVAVVKGFLSRVSLDPSFIAKINSSLPAESPLKMAVLSPYNQQVSLLRKELANLSLPEGIVPKEALRTRRAQSEDDNRSSGRPQLPLVHTVDSFQGNEADIILVSLVRNNIGRERHSNPLGFLEERERMNVLLSRAQRLLVLVGSWDFFVEQVDPIPLEDRMRKQWPLKKVITLLEEFFTLKKAIKLVGADFVEVET